MKNLLKNILLSTSLLTMSSLANASLITNGSFEQLTFSDNTTTTGLISKKDLSHFNSKQSAWDVFTILPGWFTSAGTGIELQKNVVTKSQDGSNHVELDSHPRNASNATMTQTINSLTIGNEYLLEFYYKARTNALNDNGINVFWYDATQSFNNSMDEVFSVNSTRNLTPTWQKQSVSFVADATSMKVSFASFGNQNTLGGLIDNVSLNNITKVPEPTTFALFAICIAMLIYRQRKLTQ